MIMSHSLFIKAVKASAVDLYLDPVDNTFKEKVEVGRVSFYNKDHWKEGTGVFIGGCDFAVGGDFTGLYTNTIGI